jgi:hypothetical protein
VAEPLSEVVLRALSVYLGPHAARSAVRTFSERELGKPPEALSAADCPALLAALKPMLQTLLGSDQADNVLAQLAEELPR